MTTEHQDLPLHALEPVIPPAMAALLQDSETEFMQQFFDNVLLGLKRRKEFVISTILQDHYKEPIHDDGQRDAIYARVTRVSIPEIPEIESFYLDLDRVTFEGKHICTIENRVRDNLNEEPGPYRVTPYILVTVSDDVPLPAL